MTEKQKKERGEEMLLKKKIKMENLKKRRRVNIKKTNHFLI